MRRSDTLYIEWVLWLCATVLVIALISSLAQESRTTAQVTPCIVIVTATPGSQQ